jgi:hypothetical protein
MRKREPKLVEGPKKTLIIKGNKTSNITTQFLKDIVPKITMAENSQKTALDLLLPQTRYTPV